MLTDLYAPYNDLSVFSASDCPNLAYVNLAWNDLTNLNLSNQTFLQNLNVSNNQLLTLDVTFDTNLRIVNVTNNYNLSDIRVVGDYQLAHVIGASYDFNY